MVLEWGAVGAYSALLLFRLTTENAGAGPNRAKFSVGGELFSLIIDAVGDVLTLSHDSYENAPPTLAPAWRDVSLGIHKLDGKILVVLDVKRLLGMAAVKKEIFQ